MQARREIALLTPGEPAGIGPELVCQLAAQQASTWVAVADPDLLASRAKLMGLELEVCAIESFADVGAPKPGRLYCWPVSLAVPSLPGQLAVANASYVVACLTQAAEACMDGSAQGLITGPVHKGIINQSGLSFSGHTEHLQNLAGVDHVVMMLACETSHQQTLRVALVTTHLPLKAVSEAITARRVERTLEVVHADLQTRFGIAHPRLSVLGLNPHAGEGGHLGDEEINIIEPVLAKLKARGFDITGPLPADTAFLSKRLDETDCVVAMYHDQGLPVLKTLGFGDAVNITLGLPYIRTSVDHGTALDIAGKGQADLGSLKAAVEMARALMSAKA